MKVEVGYDCDGFVFFVRVGERWEVVGWGFVKVGYEVGKLIGVDDGFEGSMYGEFGFGVDVDVDVLGELNVWVDEVGDDDVWFEWFWVEFDIMNFVVLGEVGEFVCCV